MSKVGVFRLGLAKTAKALKRRAKDQSKTSSSARLEMSKNVRASCASGVRLSSMLVIRSCPNIGKRHVRNVSIGLLGHDSIP